MTFPTYRRAATYRATVPALSGGLNVSLPPHAVKDHQLTALENYWWKDGVLHTRPGLQVMDEKSFSVLGYVTNTTSLSKEPILAGGAPGTLLLGVARAGAAQNHIESLQVGNTGEMTAFSNDVAYSMPIRKMLHVTDEKNADSLGVLLTDSVQAPLLKLLQNGSVRALEPYIPTILVQVTGDAVSSVAESAGYSFESHNMLTDAFSMECVTGEQATYFHLPSSVRGKEGALTVAATDAQGTVEHLVTTIGTATVFTEQEAKRDGLRLRIDRNAGTFWFVGSNDSPVCSQSTPYVGFTATFRPTVDTPTGRSVITGMQFGTWFGGDNTGVDAGTRFFVAGNPDYPHLLHYSSLNDITYFPENNYVYVGHPGGAITALKQQGNRLIIFKEHELFSAGYASSAVTAESVLQGGVIDVETARAAFPITPISAAVGCDCPASIALCGNRLIWATSDGAVYTLHSVSSKSERNLRRLSTPIEPLLEAVAENTLKAAVAVDFEGCYGLFAGNEVFLFHYDEQSFYNYSSYDASDRVGNVLAWYRWTLPDDFSYQYVTAVGDHLVFIGFVGTKAVTYMLSGKGDSYYPDYATGTGAAARKTAAVKGSFCTKRFDFEQPERKKQIKRLTLYAEPCEEATATVTYQSDRGDDCGGTPFCGEELPLTLHPNSKRVRQFGIRIDSSGQLSIHGFCVRYDVQG